MAIRAKFQGKCPALHWPWPTNQPGRYLVTTSISSSGGGGGRITISWHQSNHYQIIEVLGRERGYIVSLPIWILHHMLPGPLIRILNHVLLGPLIRILRHVMPGPMIRILHHVMAGPLIRILHHVLAGPLIRILQHVLAGPLMHDGPLNSALFLVQKGFLPSCQIFLLDTRNLLHQDIGTLPILN